MDTKYRYATYTNTQRDIQLHDYGVSDAKGRAIGSHVYTYVQTVTERADDGRGGSIAKPEDFGTWYTFGTCATRDGEDYGPMGSSFDKGRRFRTAAERDAAVAKYVAAAHKRAKARL